LRPIPIENEYIWLDLDEQRIFTYHSRSQSPVPKAQPKVKGDKIPPSPWFKSLAKQAFSLHAKQDLHVLFSGGVGSKSSLLHLAFEPGCPCLSSAVSGVWTKLLKSAPLRNAFLKLVAFSAALALKLVASIPLVRARSGVVSTVPPKPQKVLAFSKSQYTIND